MRLHKATQMRKKKKEENLQKIVSFIEGKGIANNIEIRDFLHVSQSTATDYLHNLVSSGRIKTEGKGKATIYHL